MNIIDLMENKFLHSLFPGGVVNNILIGQMSLDLAEQIMISIHVNQPPKNEVSKWGVWGKDYNIIVINALAQFISNVQIVNWQNVCPAPLNIYEKDNGVYQLSVKGDDWSIIVEMKSLTFQRCDVYIK
jgi:hypothetical protein